MVEIWRRLIFWTKRYYWSANVLILVLLQGHKSRSWRKMMLFQMPKQLLSQWGGFFYHISFGKNVWEEPYWVCYCPLCFCLQSNLHYQGETEVLQSQMKRLLAHLLKLKVFTTSVCDSTVVEHSQLFASKVN